MSSKARKGLEDGPTAEAPTENERVTARIVREDDGTTHHRYHVGGRVFESLTALRAALGGQR
jgi:hypothetical protein